MPLSANAFMDLWIRDKNNAQYFTNRRTYSAAQKGNNIALIPISKLIHQQWNEIESN